jgi:hypothetical protein
VTKAQLLALVQSIYADEADLITLEVGEWVLVFRLAWRLRQLLETQDDPLLRVDCDYNKWGKSLKVVLDRERRPDIIAHRRGNGERNLLAIECKRLLPRNRGDRIEDIRKLFDLKNDEEFAYEHIALVEFGANFAKTRVSWGVAELEARLGALEQGAP